MSAAEVLDGVLASPTWALIRRRDADSVLLLGGTRTDLDELAQIPLKQGVPKAGRRFDSLVLVPYAQARERGFEAHQDGTPLSCIRIEREHELALDELRAALPDTPIEVSSAGGFEIDDGDYAAIVEAIIRDEIGNGEAANLVIGRRYAAQLADWSTRAALGVLRRLLSSERGAYWTFCAFTGDRYLIGASPERHLSIASDSVRMNPISGTLRLTGSHTVAERKAALLTFLADEKEIYELFMVVDEELKMMCDICTEGGLVLGPYLKQMAHVIHTEYLLAGRTSRDPRQVLRDSMFAATVTGSPVQNACRLITRYEPDGRGYYGSVMALIGRDGDGQPTVDAPILIRTADVSVDGRLCVVAGATLVRDSDPAYEVAETHAKAAGILTAFGLVDAPEAGGDAVSEVADDDDVLIALGSRNSRLSSFWLTDQSGTPAHPVLRGRSAVILDGEDAFVNMLRHLLGVLGICARVVSHEQWTPEDFDGCDLVVVGPGPGDPRDEAAPKVEVFRAAISAALESRQPLLAVCLGHQVLCGLLGFDLGYKDIVFQGTQTRLPMLGRHEVVGFYNTFVARAPSSGMPAGLSAETDPASGDVHLVSGPHFRGVQFHAESILTHRGAEILSDLVCSLLMAE
ncbi:MAG: phenazine-specific anthranilate synthase [Nocardioidaceae bacterium]|nr:phenazine-specific anthranilate synthase [Nocardioidaceae bacterium]